MIGRIILKEPVFESLTLARSSSFPHEMKLRTRLDYGKAVLSVDSPSQSKEIAYKGGLYTLQSKGSFNFVTHSKTLTINARLSDVWNYKINEIWAETAPLTLDDIHEIDEQIGSDDVQFYWDIEAWGLIETSSLATKYVLESGFVYIKPSCDKRFRINRQDFIKNVLEPADLLRRMFIDVIFEPLGSLDEIIDPKMQGIMKMLLDKQRILIEAYTKFKKASSSNDYRSVISDVRLAVENLNTPEIHDVLKKAYENVGIANGATSEVSDEVSYVVTGQKGDRGSIEPVYKFACKLAAHSKTKDLKNYLPKPFKHDAEFALLQAIGILNYLIKVLKLSSRRV